MRRAIVVEVRESIGGSNGEVGIGKLWGERGSWGMIRRVVRGSERWEVKGNERKRSMESGGK